MIRYVALMCGFIMAGALAEEALAAKISLTATVSQVRMACSKAGGSFSAHMDGGGYGCVKANCDGKGGNCQVQCDNNNNCTGTTPSRTAAATTVTGILVNGGAVKSSGHAPVSGGILNTTPGLASPRPSAIGRAAPN
jgi:hypothetical protein